MIDGVTREEADSVKQTWPKTTTVYLHSSKESMWEVGEQLGLSEEVIQNDFMYALYEVAIDIEVNEDGTYKVIDVKD